MSYCRFRNTLNDLRDCYHNFESVSSEEEARARKQLLQLCESIVEEYGGMDLDELEEIDEDDFEDEDDDF